MRSCCVAAIRFIRQHAQRSFSIDFVVDAVVLILCACFAQSDYSDASLSSSHAEIIKFPPYMLNNTREYAAINSQLRP